jgi:SAM-dependent methyltransferase
VSDAAEWSRQFKAGLTSPGMAAYKEIMVPRLFSPWAGRLLDLLEVEPGLAVLDVACGPGTVARAAAARVGPYGTVAGCDLSPTLLEIAVAKGPVQGGAAIEYVECPADHLAVADRAYDVITCQHGLQFFPDRLAALTEMRRAGRPGARLGVAVWGPIEQSPLFAGLGRAVERILGPASARAYRAGPYGFPDEAALLDVAVASGFSDVDVHRESLPLALEGGPVQLVATLSIAGIGAQVAALDERGQARLLDAVEEEVGPLAVHGELRSETTAHLLLATA